MEEKFTFEQFKSDVNCNAKRLLDGGYLKLDEGKDIYYYISDDADVNAKASKSSDEQYILKINNGLLVECYNYIDNYVRSYYQVAARRNNLTEEAFLRLVAGTFSEMIFLHEYSHIVRGHIEYLDHIEEKGSDLLKYERSVEIDADAYGASFLFARIYAIYLDRVGYTLETLMQAFAIGIRSTFEVLYRDNPLQDYSHKESSHPHSLVRAYSALIHALSSPVLRKISPVNRQSCINIALRELLAFEEFSTCSKIDLDMLKEHVSSDWSFYHDTKVEIDKFTQLKIEEVPLRTKIKEARFWARIKKAFLNLS